MSDTETNAEAGAEQTEGGASNASKMPYAILLQYLKDLSFENPKAPVIFTQERQQPELDVKVDVTVQQLSEQDYEVTLHLNGEAKENDEAIYLTEMAYAGVVRVAELQPELLQQVLFVEIPRLLFPYARSIFSTAVGNGGFPAVMLAPVDFMDLLRRRIEAARAAEGEGNGEDKEETATA